MRKRIQKHIPSPRQSREKQNQASGNRYNTRTPGAQFRSVAYDIKLQPKAFVEKVFDIHSQLYSSTTKDIRYRQIDGAYESLVKWIGKELMVPADMSLDEFWTTILLEIQKLCGKNHWNITTFNGDYNYCITEFSHLSQCIENGNAMPLEWIVRIKEEKYRWAIEKLISYIIQQCTLPICGHNIEDDYYVYAIDSLENRIMDDNEDPEDLQAWKDFTKSYSEGSIYNYTLAIRNQKVTMLEIDKAMDILKPLPEILDWLRTGVQLAKEGYGIYQFIYNPRDPDDEECRPIMFDNMVGFYWHTNDPVFQEVDEFLNANHQEAGVMPPVNIAIHSPLKSEKLENNDWPLRLYKWHTVGNKLISKYEPKLCKPCPTSLSYINQPLSLASIKPKKATMSIRK